jgi:hypothetical protein
MRVLIAIAAFSFTGQLAAQTRPPFPREIPVANERAAFRWELDAVGSFGPQMVPDANNFSAEDFFRVLEVLSPNEMLLEGVRKWPASGVSVQGGGIRRSPERVIEIHKPFILKGRTTRGIVDDAEIKLDGFYRVIDTKKRDGRTVFVIRPATDEEKPKELELLPMPRLKLVPSKPKPPMRAEPAAPKVEKSPPPPVVDPLASEEARRRLFAAAKDARADATRHAEKIYSDDAGPQRAATVRLKMNSFANAHGISLKRLEEIEAEGRAKGWK